GVGESAPGLLAEQEFIGGQQAPLQPCEERLLVGSIPYTRQFLAAISELDRPLRLQAAQTRLVSRPLRLRRRHPPVPHPFEVPATGRLLPGEAAVRLRCQPEIPLTPQDTGPVLFNTAPQAFRVKRTARAEHSSA